MHFFSSDKYRIKCCAQSRCVETLTYPLALKTGQLYKFTHLATASTKMIALLAWNCKVRPQRFDNSNRTCNFELMCQDSGWVRGSSQGLISQDLASPTVSGKNIPVHLPGVEMKKKFIVIICYKLL